MSVIFALLMLKIFSVQIPATTISRLVPPITPQTKSDLPRPQDLHPEGKLKLCCR